jgi:glycosyltransferase involved in cell wall biosynthesis
LADLFFSLIIPTYNRLSHLPGTLRSVLSQRFGSFEVIVVDDGSKDGTWEWLETQDDHRLRIIKQQNAERGAARNTGWAEARGQYVSFLDSDDQLLPDFFMKAKQFCEEKAYPAFFHVGYAIADPTGRIKVKVDQLSSGKGDFLLKGNPLSCIGVFVRRELFPEYSFNPDRDLAGSEDWELWMRIAARFGIECKHGIHALLIDHDSRSVMHYNEKALMKRKSLAISSAYADRWVQEKYADEVPKVESHWYSYVALHLALSDQRKRALHYWLQSIRFDGTSIFQRRTLGILKHLMRNHR